MEIDPAKLAKVGWEGFALVDECLRREYRPAHRPGYPATKASAALRKDKKQSCDDKNQPQHPQSVVHNGQSPAVCATEDRLIDCYQAAQRYGGILIVDYRKKKPTYKAF